MNDGLHSISVVVPVYQGRSTLPTLLAELSAYFEPSLTRDGNRYRVEEVLLVDDNGPDASDVTIRELAAAYPQVRPVWLSRNFGQHSATLAGMASSGGDWVVTLDEDGQHDPRFIPDMLDTALREQATIVYSRAVNEPPHGAFRNLSSRWAKRIVSLLIGDRNVTVYQSYRLVLGEVARGVSAYAGPDIYLDIALAWISTRVAQCDVELREEGGRPSGYSLHRLLSHFWKMFLTSGTKGLRIVSVVGAALAAIGIIFAVFVVIARVFSFIVEPGWASLMVVFLVGFGAVLFSLGVVAEYVGIAVKMAVGRPAYFIGTDRERGPLGRATADHAREDD